MNRKNAIKISLNFFKNSPVVSANGFISRDLFNVNDKKSNFYMIGSMGLASSIGLGIALKNIKKMIIVFDGDGNILMNLGSITTIGANRPKNLIHVIFDNFIHESTGGQPTNSQNIKIKNLGLASNYKVFPISTENKLKNTLQKIKQLPGPIMLVIKIGKNNEIATRVEIEPIEIRNRFMRYLSRDKN